ncbi:MAG: PD40 domain-containing protein, partial [Verrucomicrobiales bacterium]|nr:PD40 domain-containing protein [Verrucomicrobiales bacterium]
MNDHHGSIREARMTGILRALGDLRWLRWGAVHAVRAKWSVLVAVSLWLDGRAASAQWAAPERVSVPDPGVVGVVRVTGNGESDSPRLSRDGRFVVFASSASDLVTNDLNGVRRDVFVRELATGQTTLISVTPEGRSGNGDSFAPDLSADGRFVVFASRASDLVAGDGNGLADVFVRDRVAGRTVRVSVATDGAEGDGDSFGPGLTPDGQWVVFGSRAGNLDAAVADRDERVDVFLHRVETGTTTLVTREAREGTGNEQDIDDYAVSDDGQWVAFSTVSTNVVAGATQRIPLGAYVHDVARAQTFRLETTLGPVSLVRATAEARTLLFAPGRARLAIGTWVAISTTNGSNLVEVVDLTAAGPSFVGGAVGWGGTLLDEPTSLSFNAAGDALALTQSLAPSQPAVLRVWRADTGVVTPTNALTLAPVRAREVALSPAGDQVVFTSLATNLVAFGTPARQVQLYRLALATGEVALMSTNETGRPVGGMDYARPGFNSEGTVVFQSASDAWRPGDGNRSADVYLADVASGNVG